MTEQEELRDDVPPATDDETEEGASRSPGTEWEENEPSPHQGEEGQQESEA